MGVCQRCLYLSWEEELIRVINRKGDTKSCKITKVELYPLLETFFSEIQRVSKIQMSNHVHCFDETFLTKKGLLLLLLLFGKIGHKQTHTK